MTPQEILEIKFESGDLHKTVTVRQFLILLVEKLWKEEECFSGKRPFGNSSWKGDLKVALIKAGAVVGHVDADDYAYEIDDDAFNAAIKSAIQAL